MSACVPISENVPHVVRIWWVSKSKENINVVSSTVPRVMRTWKQQPTNALYKWLKRPNKRNKSASQKKKRDAATSLATLEANGEGMNIGDEKEKPPLHVFFDIEAMQDKASRG